MDDENGDTQKFPVENTVYPCNVGASYNEEDENEEEDEYAENGGDNEEEDDDDDDDDGGNGVQRISKEDYEYGDKDDTDDEGLGDIDHPAKKKRKLKSLLSSYELAPRVPTPAPVPAPVPLSASASAPKPSYGGRNPLTDWTEHETFVLLEAWGERFLKQGRKSLRSEEWQAVADAVSRESRMERTDTQCRNRLDTLKKKYKKEKMKWGGARKSTWVYFKKMDELLSLVPQQAGLSCGVDSGEYVFMNPKVYVNQSNGLDEMRDSPADSGDDDNDHPLDDLPPPTSRNRGTTGSFKLLADSIQKFSDVYLRIEKSKRQQMVEIGKMQKDFQRDMEVQMRQILERTRAEIEKIRQGEDEDNDLSG